MPDKTPIPLTNAPEPEADYFASGAWGSTSARRALVSIRAARDAFDGIDEKDSPALTLGRLVDSHWTGAGYAIRPEGPAGRTKEGKAWLAAVAPGVQVATQEQARQIHLINERMPEGIHAMMRGMRAAGQVQRVFRVCDPETGLWVQARFDFLAASLGYDLKTTSRPVEDFGRSALTYGYPFQAAWYRWVAGLCGYPVTEFKFIVCETVSPYRTVVFQPDSDFLAFGDAQRMAALEKLAKATGTGTWGDDGDPIRLLTLPRWALKPGPTAGDMPAFED